MAFSKLYQILSGLYQSASLLKNKVDTLDAATVKAVDLVVAATTEGFAKSYQLTVDGQPVGAKIDLYKDQFLKGANFIAAATETDVAAAGTDPGFVAGEPVLKLTMQVTRSADGAATDVETVIYVPMKGLVDTYVGADGIEVDNYTVKLSAENVARLVKVDSAVTAAADLTADKVVLGAGDKTAKTSVYGIGAEDATGYGHDTTVATEKGTKAYVDGQISDINAAAELNVKSYILNGSTSDNAGVPEWADEATVQGSAAKLLADITAFNATLV